MFLQWCASIPQSAISGFYVNNNLLKAYPGYVREHKEKKQQVLTLQYNERDFGFDVVGIGFSLPGPNPLPLHVRKLRQPMA